jgi:hypothetical protein
MYSIIQDIIDKKTTDKKEKHIQFDLSRNQTYIIDNNYSLSTYSSENIPFITILSSLLFLTNTILAYINEYYVYALFFLFLTITSLVHRLYTSNYTFIIDKIAIAMVVSYGGYVLYQNTNNISRTYLVAVISTFIATILLYYYGYINKCFCFDQDNCIAENYMALLHIFSSIGHNMIIAIPGSIV